MKQVNLTADFWVDGDQGKVEVFLRDPIPHELKKEKFHFKYDDSGVVTVIQGGLKIVIPSSNVKLIRHTFKES